MRDLADQERFEEAALARERLRALAEALARARVDGWLLGAGHLILRDGQGHRFDVRRGALIRTERDEPLGSPCPRDRADELSVLRSWVSRHDVRIEAADVPIAEPVDGGAALDRILRTLRGASNDDAGLRLRRDDRRARAAAAPDG
jgi:hypothetical protein